MRFEKSQKATRDALGRPGIPYLPGEVTADNFVEKAIAFMRASGREDGEHPVVKRAENAIAFWAWIAFWQHLGRPTSFAERSESLTVPTTFPWDFSVDADHLRDEDLAPAAHREAPITPQRRRELAAMLRGVVPRDLGRAGHKPRRSNNPRLPDGFGTAHEPQSERPLASAELLDKLAAERVMP